MKLFAKVENICAAALILAFFLPWVSIGGLLTIHGYKIPDIVQALSGLGSSLAEMGNETGQASQGTPAVTYAIYGLYLIPLLAVYFLVRAGTGKSTKGVGLAAGLLPVAAFAFVFIKGGMGALKVLGFGAFLTIASAIGLLLYVTGVVKARETAGLGAQ